MTERLSILRGIFSHRRIGRNGLQGRFCRHRWNSGRGL